jgi:hypothetical protein
MARVKNEKRLQELQLALMNKLGAIITSEKEVKEIIQLVRVYEMMEIGDIKIDHIDKDVRELAVAWGDHYSDEIWNKFKLARDIQHLIGRREETTVIYAFAEYTSTYKWTFFRDGGVWISPDTGEHVSTAQLFGQFMNYYNSFKR